MPDTYDGLILGTGHNALVLQAYLSRCGLKTLSLDRANVAGGGLRTEEDPRHPGFFHNTHSFFHRAISAMPWFRDLELARHRVRYLEPELNVALLTRHGRALCWWTDLERTLVSFREFSTHDAEKLKYWHDEFVPIVEQILIPEAQSPPLPPEEREAKLQQTTLGRRLLEVSSLSPLEFVDREFENDVVKAGLLFFNGLREVDLRQRGFGHSIPALMASKHKAQMCVGGSANLARGLIEDITEHGGQVRLGMPLRRLLVENDRVVGVECESGEQLFAKAFVASGLNPQQTFLHLLESDLLPPGLATKAEQFQYNLLAPLFALNLSLSEPPRYRHLENQPELDRAFMTILGLEQFDQFHDIVRCHEQGRIPPTVMWGACPTVFDPSQAPPGCHTAFMWEKLPFKLEGHPERWDQVKQQHGERMLDLWSDYAPNLQQSGVVIDAFTRSPLDTYRTLPNMAMGDLLVGAFAHGQVGYNRPFAGAGQYRTPIGGLYLCGGSTHPGGNITGLCGYNAARVIAEDLQLSIWWQHMSA